MRRIYEGTTPQGRRSKGLRPNPVQVTTSVGFRIQQGLIQTEKLCAYLLLSNISSYDTLRIGLEGSWRYLCGVHLNVGQYSRTRIDEMLQVTTLQQSRSRWIVGKKHRWALRCLCSTSGVGASFHSRYARTPSCLHVNIAPRLSPVSRLTFKVQGVIIQHRIGEDVFCSGSRRGKDCELYLTFFGQELIGNVTLLGFRGTKEGGIGVQAMDNCNYCAYEFMLECTEYSLHVCSLQILSFILGFVSQSLRVTFGTFGISTVLLCLVSTCAETLAGSRNL